ncbi:MAG: protoporphyrinogen oxidase, partial [Pirellulaceae bacterium]
MQKRVAVVGGGISGLAAVHHLRELDPSLQVDLYEGEDKLGGVLQTTRTPEYLLEHSADNFITNIPWGLDLCRRLGLEPELLPTNESLRKAYVVCRGKLEEVPEGFLLMAPGKIWPILTTPILSPWGKLRLAAEYFVRRRTETSDESLRSFVERRLGREVYQRLVQPLIGGIYTADPDKLSIQATLRQFVEMEQRHGGLIRGMRKRTADAAQSGARYSMFTAPRGGMTALVEALIRRMDPASVHLSARVDAVSRAESMWRVEVNGQILPFDGVIVAAPAPHAANLLRGETELAKELEAIPYAGCSLVILTVDEKQIKRPIRGFGFVVPEIEKRKILAASFASYKFPDRAPEGKTVIRVFVGGACQPELGHLPDDRLRAIVQEELGDLIGLVGEPEQCLITRWHGKMPQYHLNHLDRVERIERHQDQLPGLALAGNAYRGVGIPQCIHSGEEA